MESSFEPRHSRAPRDRLLPAQRRRSDLVSPTHRLNESCFWEESVVALGCSEHSVGATHVAPREPVSVCAETGSFCFELLSLPTQKECRLKRNEGTLRSGGLRGR